MRSVCFGSLSVSLFFFLACGPFLPVAAADAHSITSSRGLAWPAGNTPRKAATPESEQNRDWHRVTVQRGDTLSGLFAEHGFAAQTWREILRLGHHAGALTALQPGDVIAVRKTADGRLAGLRFRLDKVNTFVVRRDAGGVLYAEIDQLDTRAQRFIAAGEVHRSLPAALAHAGVPSAIADELAQIYQPRVDLARDIQPGDRFSVVYQALYHHGKRIKAGPVIAARIEAGGRARDVFRARGPDGRAGYYDARGGAYQPAISRQPVEYKRISSPFAAERMDPAIHVLQPHNGVDMAAPTGTPIHAAGDGRVKYVGWARGYGRLVEIAHGNGYSTRYAHLHRYAHGLRDGQHVDRGQVIGTVGNTGWSTGPHLLYEIRHHGVPHDPMTMRLPPAPALAGARLQRFENRIRPLFATLDNPLIDSRSLTAWVSSLSCDRAATINAQLALDPAAIQSRAALNQLFCLAHRSPPAQPNNRSD